MKLCLDTNAYAAFKYGSREVKSILEDADELFLPATVLGELYSGFQIGSLTEKNLKELDEFLSKPGVFLIETNNDIAFRYGFLVKSLKELGKPIPTNDIWIAASAMEKGAILLSNDRHFSFIPGLIVMGFTQT